MSSVATSERSKTLSLLVDGKVVAAQSFGVAASPALDEPAEQAIHAFTLSFDSDAYDSATGAVEYDERHITIYRRQLSVAGSGEPLSSNAIPLTSTTKVA